MHLALTPDPSPDRGRGESVEVAMARRFRMCVVEGCERRSQLGQMVCKDHEGTELGVTTSRQVVKLEREMRALALAESDEERRKAAQRFQRRVERGDFAAIFSGKFRELMEQGAEQGLNSVAGALQVAIVRLLMEERDPAKMATALAKVAHATSNVMRTKDALERRKELVDQEIALAREVFAEEMQREQDVLDAKWRSVDGRESKASRMEWVRERGNSWRAVTVEPDDGDGLAEEAAMPAASERREEEGELTEEERRRRYKEWQEAYLRQRLEGVSVDEEAPRRG